MADWLDPVDSAAFRFSWTGRRRHHRRGAGDDRVLGGKGSDLMGGTGSDFMRGGKGNDLMIAGFTDNANNLAALDAALADWRIGDLASALLDLGTLHDDGDGDNLKGNGGNDELLADPATP